MSGTCQRATPLPTALQCQSNQQNSRKSAVQREGRVLAMTALAFVESELPFLPPSSGLSFEYEAYWNGGASGVGLGSVSSCVVDVSLPCDVRWWLVWFEAGGSAVARVTKLAAKVGGACLVAR